MKKDETIRDDELRTAVELVVGEIYRVVGDCTMHLSVTNEGISNLRFSKP